MARVVRRGSVMSRSMCMIAAFATLLACRSETSDQKDASSTGQTTVRSYVITQEDQRALTPDAVLQRLKDGNARFVRNDLTSRDHSAMVRKAAKGQHPKAVVLSCIDSRLPVEDVFDCGIGDLFVGRVAGNFVDVDQLGSMEFGAKVSGAKLIVVMGHADCGAIKGAIDGVQLGNITDMLAKLQPSITRSQDFTGDKTSKNAAFVDYVGKNNVLATIEDIKSKSPILKEMSDKGELRIVGAYYDLATGAVTFL
jgi:carbonic anhydrase